MAAKPPLLRPWGPKECAVLTLIFVVSAVITVAVVTGIYFLATFLDRQFPDTVFTVAITGVTGLDLARDVDLPTTPPAGVDYSSSPPRAPTAALSPVFNLTFQIDNTRNAYHDSCVPGLSRADVSYGGALLAGGSVPPLCAGERRSDRVAARASGENVAVPRFLRDQLAVGDASVDIKVTMPTYCQYGSCGGAVLSCKPKIGGGTSPACRLDYL